MPHSISVSDLRRLLALLRDDDVLIPNTVANLIIERDGVRIGFVDLLEGHPNIEFYE